MTRRQARRQLEHAVQGVVVAPSQKHLDEIRGNVEARMYATGLSVYLHPDRLLASHERPGEMWFVVGRAAGVIRFFVGTRVAQLVGSRASVLWLSESADLSDQVYRSCRPLLWEHKADVIAEGTPAFDEAHWFTALAISGLPDDHERANRKIAARDEDVETFLATSLEAYTPAVREESAREIVASGEESIYVLQQIYGDWRMPSLFVFRWDASVHLATILSDRGQWTIRPQGGALLRVTERPLVLGGIDWFRGSAPAGAVVVVAWPRNPLHRDDPRPFVAAVAEMSTRKGETYTDVDFIARLKSLQDRWGVHRWYQDPFSPRLTNAARARGLVIGDTDASEKLGRLALIGRALHPSPEFGPALYVSTQCPTLAEQLAGYRWQRKRDGTVTGKPTNYNDWLIDGLAYLIPHTGGILSSGGP